VAVKVHGSDVLLLGSNAARRRLTFEALGRADRVVVVSEDLRAKLIASGVDAEKLKVVYSGMDTSLFHPGSREEAIGRLGLDPAVPLVLFVGNLLPVKGLDVLIDACDRLNRRGVAFDCRLIGQGPLKRRLQKRIRARGLTGRMTLMGPRSMEQLPDWYRAARLLVLPSRSEGVPNVLMEAVACGTPIVATRVGGIPEVTGAGYSGLVPPEDAEALAGAIEARLSGGGGEVAGAFRPRSWAESAAELSAVLESLN
jgi:glycosyltransferase involved in cell wall biosynthesis